MRNWILVILPLAVLLGSCARSQEKPPEQVKQYSMHGEVIRLDPDGKIATVRAEKIQGWMEAMTMGYPVKDPKDFNALQVDHCIDATVFVQGDAFWIADVKNLNTPPENCVATPQKTQ